MWRWNDGTTELYHYGVKGMKWGVRRTKEQLAHDRYSIEARAARKFRKPFYTSNGVLVKGLSIHALDRTQDPHQTGNSGRIAGCVAKAAKL